MRVLAWPAPSQLQTQSGDRIGLQRIRTRGVRAEPYSSWTMREPAADVFHVHWPEAILWDAPPITRLSWRSSRRITALRTMDVVRRRGGQRSCGLSTTSRRTHIATQQARTGLGTVLSEVPRKVDCADRAHGAPSTSSSETYPELRDARAPSCRSALPQQLSGAAGERGGARLDRGAGGPLVIAMLGIVRRSKGIPGRHQRIPPSAAAERDAVYLRPLSRYGPCGGGSEARSPTT